MKRAITTRFPEPGSDRDAAAWAGSSAEAGRCYVEGTSHLTFMRFTPPSFTYFIENKGAAGKQKGKA